MEEHLRWTISSKKRVATVTLEGRVENGLYKAFVDRVVDDLQKRPETQLVIVNVDSVTYGDSMVLVGMLVALCTKIQSLGRLFELPVGIVTTNQRFRSYFSTTKLDARFPVADSLDAMFAQLTKRLRHPVLPVESDLVVIKGIRELRSKDPVADYQSHVLSSPASFRSLGTMDRKLGALLREWGFNDGAWCDNVQIAVSELLSNIVQHGPKGPRGGVTGRMEILCLKWSGIRYDYFVGHVSHSNGRPIPLDQLHPNLRSTKATRGRGTQIVKALMDLFVVMRGTDAIVVMKKERHATSS